MVSALDKQRGSMRGSSLPGFREVRNKTVHLMKDSVSEIRNSRGDIRSETLIILTIDGHEVLKLFSVD